MLERTRPFLAGLVALAALAFAQPSPTPTVGVWLTTASAEQKLARQPDLRLEAGQGPPKRPAVVVDGGRAYQAMEGFGASLTESSAYLLNRKLAPAQRDEVLKKLFDPQEGIGLSWLRQPMGASDFARSSYSYDDLPPGETDPQLARFSIARDEEDIIPVLQRIREINPDLRIMASPWSPPGWMKTSGSMIKGKLKPEFYPALAAYFVRFVQAYGAHGLPVHAVTVQNEPQYEPEGYPGMRMDPAEQAEFIARHLGPAFEAAGLTTKILVWDHNWDKPNFPLEVLANPQAKARVAGVAWHCYAGRPDAQGAVRDAHPDVDVYFTECSGGGWQPGYAAGLAEDMKKLVIGATRQWAKTVIKWNLVLDEQYGPQNGGCKNCTGFVQVNQGNGEVSYNVEMESIGHASKFVRRGARRIASSTGMGNLDTVAFKNPDGTKVLIVFNTDFEERAFTVVDKDRRFASKLPGFSAATFVYRY